MLILFSMTSLASYVHRTFCPSACRPPRDQGVCVQSAGYQDGGARSPPVEVLVCENSF